MLTISIRDAKRGNAGARSCVRRRTAPFIYLSDEEIAKELPTSRPLPPVSSSPFAPRPVRSSSLRPSALFRLIKSELL